jgi:hypothetical protein
MALGILCALQPVGDSSVVAEQALPAGVVAREEVKDFDERPDVPADGAAPDDGCDTSFGISPDSFLAFVVAVEGEVGIGVKGDRGDFVPLEDDVVCGYC